MATLRDWSQLKSAVKQKDFGAVLEHAAKEDYARAYDALQSLPAGVKVVVASGHIMQRLEERSAPSSPRLMWDKTHTFILPISDSPPPRRILEPRGLCHELV